MLSFSFTIFTLLHIYKMFDVYLQYSQGLCVFVVCFVRRRVGDGHGGGGGSGSVGIWMGYGYSEWIVVDNIWNAYSWSDDDDLRKEWMACKIYVVWGCVYELLKLLCWTRIWLTVTIFLACWWLWSFLPPGSWGRHPFFPRYSDLSVLRYLDLDLSPSL